MKYCFIMKQEEFKKIGGEYIYQYLTDVKDTICFDTIEECLAYSEKIQLNYEVCNNYLYVDFLIIGVYDSDPDDYETLDTIGFNINEIEKEINVKILYAKEN